MLAAVGVWVVTGNTIYRSEFLQYLAKYIKPLVPVFMCWSVKIVSHGQRLETLRTIPTKWYFANEFFFNGYLH